MSPKDVTAFKHSGDMTHYLYPTLEGTLACPSRYTREKVNRETVFAPFASSVYGKVVHTRIAHSASLGTPLDLSPITLPKRVILQAGEDLGALETRAYSCLEHFRGRILPWLRTCEVIATEHRAVQNFPYLGAWLSGIFDLIIRTPKGELIVDWKTGGLQGSEDQLRFYLALRHAETGSRELTAQVVSLGDLSTFEIGWDDELEAWIEARAKKMIETLQEIQKVPNVTRPGRHCRYCPYAHDCGGSAVGARSLLDTVTGELRTVQPSATLGI